ncbi:MAG: efflux RND transporter periplasmic adaptor subunit [Verrucomicrobia bacterium]|nr:efflux RND transporter periplasmic adaptor subunit [Verrucomicrobiota bacterium]
MPLIPATAEVQESTLEGEPERPPSLFISDQARKRSGIETAVVQRRPLTNELRTVGRILFNESALAEIVVRVDGYVERLFADFTGMQVKRGDHLAEIYSPDLFVAQRELLLAVETGNDLLIETTKSKLRLLGLTRQQVDEIASRRETLERVTLHSPIAGTIIEKRVVEQSPVRTGDVLYRIANLESVWASLDIYELDLQFVRYGQLVEIIAEAFPGQIYSGRIWLIDPVLTEETRTIRVVVNISNEERKLKPGMFANAVIRSPLQADGSARPSGVEGQFTCPMHPQILKKDAGKCPICEMTLLQIGGEESPPTSDNLPLVVPASAVLDSGIRKLVFVERRPGHFNAVQIQAGPRSGAFQIVLSGLNEGDIVATRGNFLLDSQSQILGLPSLLDQEGAGDIHKQHSPGGEKAEPTRPTAPKSTPQPHKH